MSVQQAFTANEFVVTIEVPKETVPSSFAIRQVRFERGDIEVEAQRMDITPSGALVLSKASGQVVRAFPAGGWFAVTGK